MKHFVLIFLIVFTSSCKQQKSQENLSEETIKYSKLLETFNYNNNTQPLISVHRGGKGLLNYPENCLETLKYVNDSIIAIYEIDVAQTKDSILILMHDNAIDRTTNGSGLVKNLNFKLLQEVNLVDDYGNQTNFKIPEFKEVLKWAKQNNVILTIDIKRSVNVKDVIAEVFAQQAQDISILITYDLEQALKVYQLAPQLMQSVSARNEKEFQDLLQTDIPTKNMLAFTGTRLSSNTLYQNIHKKGIRTILGTLGNLDNMAKARGNQLYNQWIDKGVDIIATDRPFEVAQTLKLYK